MLVVLCQPGARAAQTISVEHEKGYCVMLGLEQHRLYLWSMRKVSSSVSSWG